MGISHGVYFLSLHGDRSRAKCSSDLRDGNRLLPSPGWCLLSKQRGDCSLKDFRFDRFLKLFEDICVVVLL